MIPRAKIRLDHHLLPRAKIRLNYYRYYHHLHYYYGILKY